MVRKAFLLIKCLFQSRRTCGFFPFIFMTVKWVLEHLWRLLERKGTTEGQCINPWYWLKPITWWEFPTLAGSQMLPSHLRVHGIPSSSFLPFSLPLHPRNPKTRKGKSSETKSHLMSKIFFYQLWEVPQMLGLSSDQPAGLSPYWSQIHPAEGNNPHPQPRRK